MTDETTGPAKDHLARHTLSHDERDAGMRGAEQSVLLYAPVERVQMSVRLRRRLLEYGVRTLGEVLCVNEDRFMRIRGVGQTTINELRLLQRAVERSEFELVEEIETAGEPNGMLAKSKPLESLSSASPIDDLNLSTRLRNRLTKCGCTTLGDLGSIDRARFVSLSGVGKTTLHELDRTCQWVSAHVSGCEHVSPQTRAGGDEGLSNARKALRRAARKPELGLSSEQLEIVARVAPCNDDLHTLAGLLCDVVERVALCHSGSNHGRDAAIWLNYHGVLDGRKRTLRALGRAHSLSGGRVQQLVARITELSQVLLRSDPNYGCVLEALQSVFAQSLGVIPSQEFPALLQRAAGWPVRPLIHQIDALAELLRERPEAFTMDCSAGLVRHSQACSDLWSMTRDQAQIALAEIDHKQHLLDFAYDLGQRLNQCACPSRDGEDSSIPCCGARSGQAVIPVSYIRAMLSTFDPCPLLDDTVVSADWAILKFGSVKVAALEAGLRITGEPTHYSELAQLVRENSQRWHDVDDTNVRTTLMNDDRFVITQARGTYGLREWTVSAYETVGDRVEAYLRDRGRPAPVWKIIDVLIARDIPETSIRACFSQQRFRSHPDGTVGLSEWESSTEVAQSHRGSDSFFRDDRDDHFIIG